MGQMYSAPFEAVAVTALQDLFQILPPADAVVFIHSAHVGQESDAGDSEAEMLRIVIAKTDFTINGSGGTAVTPVAHERGYAAAGSTVEVNNTTQSTVQTPMQAHAFNVQAGWFWQPTPEERIVISALITDGLIIELPVAPADSLTMSGYVTFEEIGG